MSARDSVFDAIARGWIRPEDARRALEHVGGVVTGVQWRRLGLAFLLGAGLLALACGITFFIAWNWDDLGRFAKLGGVSFAILAALAARLLARPDSALRAAIIPVLLLLIGVLFGLVGQIYQSGADRWELFALWALVALPMIAGARTIFGWLPWLALLNTAITLWADTRALGLAFLWTDRLAVYWIIAAVNIAFGVLVAVGVARCERPAWTLALKRVAFVAAGACVTALALAAIFGDTEYAVPSFAAWAGFLAALYYQYRLRSVDLPLLAGATLSACVVIVSVVIRVLAEVMDDFDFGLGLFIALLVLGLATISGRWLVAVQKSARP